MTFGVAGGVQDDLDWFGTRDSQQDDGQDAERGSRVYPGGSMYDSKIPSTLRGAGPTGDGPERARPWARFPRTRWVLSAIASTLLLVACSEKVSTVTTVAARLSPVSPAVVKLCGAGGELRRALGCHGQRFLNGWLGPVSKEDGLATIQITLPRRLRSQPLVVTPSWAGDRPGERISGEPFLVPAARGGREKIVHQWRPPPKLAARGRVGMTLGVEPISRANAMRSHRFEAVRIPEGASLEVAWGRADVGVPISEVPAKLIVEATIGESDEFEEVATLDFWPGQPAEGWRTEAVDIAKFAGREVEFRFRVRLLGDSEKPSPPQLLAIPRLTVREPRDDRPSIVLVSLDTFRGDYLGREYEGRSLTPVLDKFSMQGTRFDNAIAPNPTTTASHMSLFTALYPPTHGVWGPNPMMRLHPEVPILTTLLAQAGYTTAAVTENGMLSRAVGFDRDFDFYREERGLGMWDTAGTIEQTFGDGMEWVSRHRDELFYLFLHTYQVHAPRSPLTRYESTFVKLPPGGGSRQETQALLYAAEVFHTDAWLGKLVEGLSEMVPERDLLIVIFSDHGEAFGEHDEMGHGTSLFDTTIRVPLIFWSPGRVAPGHRVATPVSLVDVGPTILELAGGEWPTDHQGRSLADWMTGEPGSGEAVPVWAVTHAAEELPYVGRIVHETALRLGEKKWVRKKPPERDTILSFEMAKDPAEVSPLSGSGDPEDQIRLWWVEQVDAAERIDSGREAVGMTDSVDADLDQKLRALGYVD